MRKELPSSVSVDTLVKAAIEIYQVAKRDPKPAVVAIVLGTLACWGVYLSGNAVGKVVSNIIK